MQLELDHRFTERLPADPETRNVRRQVNHAVYSYVSPTPVAHPKLVAASEDMAERLGLTSRDIQSDAFLKLFSGSQLLPEMTPYAMCYGGHQFGHWAGQLGDGRAINLAEVVGRNDQRWTLQLKGAGPTPYSRSADGLAVLRSSVREYVCSEAMHHLGVPTTRALSLMTTGEQVMRDMLYDGNAAYEPGAIVCRVAPSFLRFGNYQIFASRNQVKELKQLVDYTIDVHFPELLAEHPLGTPALYLAWFARVAELTATMIVHWMRVGFVHGVMNTDNMSILGLTIDYGPYGWLDNFDPDWTPNTTDAQNRRYRYSQQPNIALWNLYQLANSVFPLIDDAPALKKALEHFQADYQGQWLQMMASKLGLEQFQAGDESLFTQIESLMHRCEMDMTMFYRLLSEREIQSVEDLKDAFYAYDNVPVETLAELTQWLADYQNALARDVVELSERQAAMQAVNPKYVFRNYLAQLAIDALEKDDDSVLQNLTRVLQSPYQSQDDADAFAQLRPDWARTRVGCSMLSCSS